MKQHIRFLMKASFWVAFGILVGRLLGFVREVGISEYYGASGASDAVILVLTVPDVLLNLLVGGALGAVLVPQFKRYPRQAGQTFVQASILLLVVFSVVVLLLQNWASPLALMLAPGVSSNVNGNATEYLVYSLWLLPLSVAAGTSTAYLHGQGKFVVASLGTFFFNAFVVIGVFVAGAQGGDLSIIVLFILIGGIFRWVSQLCVSGMAKQFFSFNKFHLDKDLVIRYLQAAAGGVGLFLLPVIARAQASYFGDGVMSLMNYAIKFIELPLGVCVAALSAALLPVLSQMSAEGKTHEYQVMTSVVIYVGSVLTLVSTMVLILFPDDYIALAFGRGLSDDSQAAAASLVRIGGGMVFFQGFIVILTAIYNSQLNVKTPFFINLIGVALFTGLTFVSPGEGSVEHVMSTLLFVYGAIFVALLAGLNVWDEMQSLKQIKVVSYIPLLLVLVFFSCASVVIKQFDFGVLVNVISSIFIAGMSIIVVFALKRKELIEAVKSVK